MKDFKFKGQKFEIIEFNLIKVSSPGIETFLMSKKQAHKYAKNQSEELEKLILEIYK